DRSVVMLITDPQFSVQAQVLSRIDDSQAAPTTSSSVPVTAPSGRPLGSTTSTSTTTTSTTTTTVPSKTTPTTNPFGAAPGETTTSTSTTTSTTVPDVLVARETGNIDGQSAGRPLLFSLLDDTALTTVKVGDIVETAGGTKSLAPQGIPIGKITAMRQRLGSRTPIVEVEPNASLTQLNFVSVVLYVPNQAAI
ncbi:MAG: rod shape-determining protein MreC, partial [Ilumatobacteraceae bacterium]